MASSKTKVILQKEDIDRTLNRIAREIWEKTEGRGDFVIIGIRRLGVTIAGRLSKKLKQLGGGDIPVGALDITLYRDDLSEIASQPVLKKTEISFQVKNKVVILCDDVLYTGRTVRAALEGIIDLGRPKTILLAVLVDRGYRELPIQPNFVGVAVKASMEERVEVRLEEEDGSDQILLTRE